MRPGTITNFIYWIGVMFLGLLTFLLPWTNLMFKNPEVTRYVVELEILMFIQITITFTYAAVRATRMRAPVHIGQTKFAVFMFSTEKFVHKNRWTVIPLIYVLLVVLTIAWFWELLSTFNHAHPNSIIYALTPPGAKGAHTVNSADIFYFSAVTFFTVGYGDVLPIGYGAKLLIELEMLVAHLETALYGGIFLNLIMDTVKSRTPVSILRKKGKVKKTPGHNEEIQNSIHGILSNNGLMHGGYKPKAIGEAVRFQQELEDRKIELIERQKSLQGALDTAEFRSMVINSSVQAHKVNLLNDIIQKKGELARLLNEHRILMANELPVIDSLLEQLKNFATVSE